MIQKDISIGIKQTGFSFHIKIILMLIIVTELVIIKHVNLLNENLIKIKIKRNFTTEKSLSRY